MAGIYGLARVGCGNVNEASAYNRSMQFIVILVLVAIVVSMASALFFMYRDAGKGSNRMFKALALRVGLSVGLFICLMVAYKLGYIGPRGIGK